MKARFLTVLLTFFTLVLLLAEGCSSDEDPAALGGKKKKDAGGDDEEICLLNNCREDIDCTDCTGGRTVCSKDERRCVACGPNAGGKECKAGSYCTKYGDCVANSVKCEEDGNGVPTITCRNTADCGACGPQFRVCDTASNRCVGCVADNTTNCQSTDICKNNTCVAKCPSECSVDEDCGDCGVTGQSEARACNKHQCAQCSPTKPCANGDRCDFDHGTCVKRCGISGQTSTAACADDNSCAGCTETKKCKIPVNGGEGKCALPANGCSEVAGIKLPSPYDRFTNLCSTDADCANVSADLNVGKILRDITGIGFIKDGKISYTMKACASVEVLDRSCGACVPCRQDSDCTDIDIDKLAGDLFGPLGSIASRLLLDKAFGPSDHKIHMMCQDVVGDYGVCLPCPNILSACAQSNASVPPSGSCAHNVCETGAALGVNCEPPCVSKVCEKDPYCCTDQWDSQCKIDVDLYCPDKTCDPDSCAFKRAGWYCASDAQNGGYRCDGSADGSAQIAEGYQCGTGAGCRRTGSGAKDPAQTCTTEAAGDSQCPIGALGKPKCFPL
jgi:hypothetical protein